jgi:tetratricopeptide (TPR) repeat protein
MLLDDLATKYGTDKGTWGYLPHYTRELEHRRHEITQVLEIGICGERDIPNNVIGASLWMWRDYFPEAHVHGIDIDPRWMLQADRISSYLGDQRDPESLRTIAAHGAPFDLIVDDAIHDPDVQLTAMRTLLPYLKPDGLYVIEDVCPYKLPGNDVSLMTAQVPKGYSCEVIRTHKAEVLLFIKADGKAAQRGERRNTEAPEETSPWPTERPLLGLVMIVRNEALRIAPVLAAFRPHIDAWTILDTGSTDGTPALIRQELARIPGTLHEEPFVDFATSRNRALELHGLTTIFTIMPNGDELSGGEALRSFLEQRRHDHAGAYRVRISPGHYYHPFVMRTGRGWHYEGRTHECAVGPDTGDTIPDVALLRDRGNRTDAEWRARWARDLDLLNRDLADDPHAPRPHFYLGQTHECLGQHAQALAFYEKRAEMGGYFDEVFEAKLRIAKMKEKLNQPWAEIQQAYLEAYAHDPRRAEPLHAIAAHWHTKEQHNIARVFAVAAAELPKPPTDLFLDEEIYNWRAADLAAISSFYAGRKSEARVFAKAAVSQQPNDERLRANLAFSALSAPDLLGATTRSIEFQPEPGWTASNPSIYCGFNQLRCIVRTVNYQIVEGRYVTPNNGGVIHTRNFLLDLDSNLRTTRAREMRDESGIPRTHFPIHGFEDARLFAWQGAWWATATACDLTEDGRREIVLLHLDDDGVIVRAEPLRGPWSDRAQKNWMPFVDGNRVRFVYATRPTTLLELTSTSEPYSWIAIHAIQSPPGGASFDHGRLRGGSQGVRFDGGWLFVVHDVAFPGDGRIYLHRIVWLDEQLRLVAMTDPFYFEVLGIEFCAGLAALNDHKLVASYSVNDGVARLAVFDRSMIRAALCKNFTI